jgi:hypothetical protein
VIVSIISRFPQLNWTAVKVTSHQHEAKDCVEIASGDGWSAWKQMPSSESSDTGRYLQAGASTALFVQADDSHLPVATSFLNGQFSTEHVVIESTRIAEYVQHRCFVMILDSGSENTKHLAPERLSRVDAFISAGGQMLATPKFEPHSKPIFRSSEPGLIQEEFWDFISEKLRGRG